MRAKTRRALKQSISIFLLIATLSAGILPPRIVALPRVVLMDVLSGPAAPAYFVSAQVAQAFRAALSKGPSRQELENEVKRLTAELARKESELAKTRQAMASYEDFRSVGRDSPFFVYSGDLLGRVRGGDSDVYSRSYTVNIGRQDGVDKGFPVVWGNIALGRISDVSNFYSRVRVLADVRSRVAVRFGRSRYEGVLVGNGRQVCPVRFVPNRVKEGEIEVGDIVVTSGTDACFPPDLVVGKVTRFTRRPSRPEADVEVELFMDFSRVENCLILKRLDEQGGD